MTRMNPWSVLFGSVVALGALIAILAWKPVAPTHRVEHAPLFIYCGAGIRAPLEVAAKAYEQDSGVRIHFQYGPSQTLVAQAEVSRTGDLLLPGDDTFMVLAQQKGLIEESVPLARMRPIVAVPQGNPLHLRGLDDLLQPNVRLAIPAPEAAAAGRLVQEALQKSGDWERVQAHTAVVKGTVSEVANDLLVGSADAGFIWDVQLVQYPNLEAVPIMQLDGTWATVSVGVLNSSPDPSAARRFMRYLAAKDQSLRFFQEHGFEIVDGEVGPESK